jgi:hypothetical protein
MNTSAKSKRRSERVPCCMTVRWLRAHNPVEMMAKDANQHGMFLSTHLTIQPNSLMQLEVKLPSGPITVFAVSRFIGQTGSGFGIGIELFLLDEPARKAWNANYRALLLESRRAQAAQAAVSSVAR